jgi:ankyrin repeat protein
MEPRIKHLPCTCLACQCSQRTPLHWASGNGQTQTVKELLFWGAQAGLTDGKHKLALHWACFRGHADTAEELIRQVTALLLLRKKHAKQVSKLLQMRCRRALQPLQGRTLTPYYEYNDTLACSCHLWPIVRDCIEPIQSRWQSLITQLRTLQNLLLCTGLASRCA